MYGVTRTTPFTPQQHAKRRLLLRGTGRRDDREPGGLKRGGPHFLRRAACAAGFSRAAFPSSGPPIASRRSSFPQCGASNFEAHNVIITFDDAEFADYKHGGGEKTAAPQSAPHSR